MNDLDTDTVQSAIAALKDKGYGVRRTPGPCQREASYSFVLSRPGMARALFGPARSSVFAAWASAQEHAEQGETPASTQRLSASNPGGSGNGGTEGGRVPVEARVAGLLLEGGASEQLADIAERVSIVAGQAESNQSVSDDEPLVGGEGTAAEDAPLANQPVDDRQRFRLFVIIDEAKILSTGGGDTDSPDRILNQLFTEARKFGLGMILSDSRSTYTWRSTIALKT